MIHLKYHFYTIFLFLLYSSCTLGQTLPYFNAKIKNGATVISWNAPAEKLSLLVIQKSMDSLNGFKSIASMPDPNTASNGYVDKKNNSLDGYYRIFYGKKNGTYFFTPSKQAKIEKIKPIGAMVPQKDSIQKVGFIEHSKNNMVSTTVAEKSVDSAAVSSKKELVEPRYTISENAAFTNFSINIFTEKWDQQSNLKSSPFLFVDKNNNLMLMLPETHKRKFQLKVWRNDGTSIFTMKNIKDAHLLIDKSNFIFSGWFIYEILEGENLKEKGKILIEPD